MARYIDADELKQCSSTIEYKDEWHMTKYGEFVELADIENAPTADEEKIATEYCMKRCLVMLTMDTYEKLIACYNRCAGLWGERRTDDDRSGNGNNLTI